jgi:hypothetical protein
MTSDDGIMQKFDRIYTDLQLCEVQLHFGFEWSISNEMGEVQNVSLNPSKAETWFLTFCRFDAGFLIHCFQFLEALSYWIRLKDSNHVQWTKYLNQFFCGPVYAIIRWVRKPD